MLPCGCPGTNPYPIPPFNQLFDKLILEVLLESLLYVIGSIHPVLPGQIMIWRPSRHLWAKLVKPVGMAFVTKEKLHIIDGLVCLFCIVWSCIANFHLPAVYIKSVDPEMNGKIDGILKMWSSDSRYNTMFSIYQAFKHGAKLLCALLRVYFTFMFLSPSKVWTEGNKRMVIVEKSHPFVLKMLKMVSRFTTDI